MHKLNNISVGFLPNSSDFSHPQDRRRFMPFLKELNIKPEIADFNKHYDVLYISLSCDLNLWSTYKKHHTKKETRIIFDLSDNYLSDNTFNSILRSVAHYFFGRTKTFVLDYRTSIHRMLKASDIVTVGSIEQCSDIMKYHNDVRVVRDVFDEDIISITNTSKNRKEDQIDILWEGLSHGIRPIFKRLRRILDLLKDRSKKINLHIVSDKCTCLFLGKLFCRPTENVLNAIFKKTNISIIFYEWTKKNINLAASRCDFALILIPNKPFMISKPENKLLLFWSLGLPVLVSDTPSYSRVMLDSSNESYICKSDKDWIKNIKIFSEIKIKREENLNNGIEYVKNNLNHDAMISFWKSVFFYGKK